jgi:hypothetical protein
MTKHDMMTWIRRASLWWGLGFSLIYIAGIAMAYSRPSGRFHYWLGDIDGSIRFVIFNQSDFLDRFVVHTIADGPTPPEFARGVARPSTEMLPLPDEVGSLLTSSDKYGEILIVQRSGWPARFLAGHARQRFLGPIEMFGTTTPPALTWSTIRDDRFLLVPGELTLIPLRPIWRPALVLSAVAGSLGFALGELVRMARKARRRARGRCESCGYSVRGQTICPECGCRLVPTRA